MFENAGHPLLVWCTCFCERRELSQRQPCATHTPSLVGVEQRFGGNNLAVRSSVFLQHWGLCFGQSEAVRSIALANGWVGGVRLTVLSICNAMTTNSKAIVNVFLGIHLSAAFYWVCHLVYLFSDGTSVGRAVLKSVITNFKCVLLLLKGPWAVCNF